MADAINTILEFFYILIGLLAIMTAVRVFRVTSHPTRFGTAAFWLLLGVVFAFGNFIPYIIDGILIVLMGCLTMFKQVQIGKIVDVDEAKAEASARKIGSLIFVPCISLAVIAVAISYTPLGGQVGIGIASVLALLIAIAITGAKPKTVFDDSDRMLRQVGTAGILPQLLAALGVIFNAAGVGDVISQGISGVVPEGNRLAGVVAYCLGMMIFTMIMGNGFAAFTVITAGIGVPFVIAQGGGPCCCWCVSDDRWLLRHVADTYGCQFQCIASGVARNERCQWGDQSPSADCFAVIGDPYRFDVLLGVLVIQRK